METIINFFTENQSQLISIAKSIILTIFIIIATVVSSKVLRKAVRKAVYRISKKDEIITKLLTNISGYIVYLIGLVIILDLFGVNTASLVALVGAAGLAIGFALKDTLSNVAAGVMLLFLKPFKKSEFIEVSGHSGSVIDVGLFTTTLKTADGIFVSIPNGSIWSGVIKNFSRNDERRMDITISISYDDSIEDGLNVLKELVAEDSRILTTPEPKYLVHTFADSSVNLQLRAWAPTADYWDVHWDIQQKVKQKVESKGLSIPYPQRDLHIIHSNNVISNKVE